ncbi:MAG: hypothetical protein IPL40_00645 [Proteobacteria bacterium]|nr:hypothetical protein [Pseudomonadota bacterium]
MTQISAYRPAEGFVHSYTLDQLRTFKGVPAADKLRWLEEMRDLLERYQTPQARALMQRFRQGVL